MRISTLLTENLSPRAGRGGWHGGPTVMGALRGVSARQALWRPAPGRHSIWELALHIAYWHYAIARRISGGEGEPFPRSPSNWPAVPARPDEAAWRRDRALVRAMHLEAARAIRAAPPAVYGRRTAGKRKWTVGETILGAAQHEAYHTGQIQLLKRLWKPGR
jgi:uncharacterized damage-inducible protein DinB